jgi:hypothetical protein
MRWDERLEGLFDDLEQQAEGLALSERDALVAEQRVAEYARVDLAARLHGSVGTRLGCEVVGVGRVEGGLSRVGDGWLLLETDHEEWLVRLYAVLALHGLSERAVAADLRRVTARLGVASALRQVAEDCAEVLVHLIDGRTLRVLLGRVGADFVEVADAGTRQVSVLPFTAVAAVRHAHQG